MYTILVNESNELVTTVKERIMQRSKLVDNLHFLVPKMYKGYDMSQFTVMMEYLMPISREYRSEILVMSNELYKDNLEFMLPFDTCLTKEHGKIEVQLTFIKVDLDEEGNSIQRVRKTTPATITIVPISAWSNVIADSALTALDQRLIQVDAMLNAVTEYNQYLQDTKADDIQYTEDENGKYIQLTANGSPIGNKIMINIADDKTVCVKYVEIDDEGNLIVTYSDGTVDNAGKTTCDAISGIYIPDVSHDGILTMTLSQDVGEPSYSWDIDMSNNWNEIEGIEGTSNYIWEEI